MQYKINRQYRLPDYDYSSDGYYFVTICTKNREHYFGEIEQGKMKLSEIGEMANEYWKNLSDHYWYIKLDQYIVMPNHIHGIIIINNPGRAGQLTGPTDKFIINPRFKLQPQKHSISIVVRNYKTLVTTWSRKHNLYEYVWQPRFYDHIIRNEHALNNIREYIIRNPSQWESDRNNPGEFYP